MAIINRPKEPKEEPKQQNGIIKSRKTSLSDSNEKNQPKQASISNGLQKKIVYAILSVFLLGIVVTVVINVDFKKLFSSKKEEPIQVKTLSLDLDRIMRIGGLIALLEKKIEQNLNALERAESLGDDVISSTMRLGLTKNLADLEKYQDEFIVELVKLHKFNTQNPDYLIKQFKKLLKSSADVYKLGDANTIKKVQTLIQSAPEGPPPMDYFKSKIKQQK